MNTKIDGIDELRRAVRMLDNVTESFNQRYDAGDLLKICRAWAASKWDFPPDEWTAGQLTDALTGRQPPDWTEDAQGNITATT